MIKINFDVMKYKSGFYIETVEGQEIKFNYMTFGLYQNTEKEYDKKYKWNVIDFNSGLSFANGATQKEAIANAKGNWEKFIEIKAQPDYKDARERFEKLKIDRDPYYYVVNSTNNVNSQEMNIFYTYKEANDCRISLIGRHTNVYIDKILKDAQ